MKAGTGVEAAGAAGSGRAPGMVRQVQLEQRSKLLELSAEEAKGRPPSPPPSSSLSTCRASPQSRRRAQCALLRPRTAARSARPAASTSFSAVPNTKKRCAARRLAPSDDRAHAQAFVMQAWGAHKRVCGVSPYPIEEVSPAEINWLKANRNKGFSPDGGQTKTGEWFEKKTGMSFEVLIDSRTRGRLWTDPFSP